MPDFSFEIDVFYLIEMLFKNVMASSKNNANTLPLLCGSVGCAVILHNEIIVRVPRGSGCLTYNVASLCNIAWGWFWAFVRWEVAYCSCGVYGASYNVLLERWQKPKTTGALAERWLGGRKKVSDSVPISFFCSLTKKLS